MSLTTSLTNSSNSSSFSYPLNVYVGFRPSPHLFEIWHPSRPLIDSIVCEWNLSTIQQALIPALTYFCCTVGSMLSGQMADYFGRYPVLLANSYMLVVSAVGSALVPNYYLFLTCRSVTGDKLTRLGLNTRIAEAVKNVTQFFFEKLHFFSETKF